jgi:hypothetical protein
MKGVATSMSSVRGLALMSRLEYFNNDMNEFLKLGKWSSDNFTCRFESSFDRPIPRSV